MKMKITKERLNANIYVRAPSGFKLLKRQQNVLQANRVGFVETWEYETTPGHFIDMCNKNTAQCRSYVLKWGRSRISSLSQN